MGRGRAVAHGLAHDHRPKTSLAGIDGGGPHATAGGAASHEQRIDSVREQTRDQIGTEKAGRILLH